MNPKVQAAGLAGAVTVVLVWAASLANVTVPPEVASAVTTLVAVGAGYLRPAGAKPKARGARGLALIEALVLLLLVIVVLLVVGVIR
jgi:hypothetical protein